MNPEHLRHLPDAPDLFAIPQWQVEPTCDHNGLRAAVVRIVLHQDEMEDLLAHCMRAGISPAGVVSHAVGEYVRRRASLDDPPEPKSVEPDYDWTDGYPSSHEPGGR